MAFCPNCGATLPAATSHCPQCNAPVANDQPIHYSTGGMIAWSIITLLLCTIPGIVALVQTCSINSCSTHAEQEKKLSSAKTWNIVGTVLGILSIIGSIGQALAQSL